MVSKLFTAHKSAVKQKPSTNSGYVPAISGQKGYEGMPHALLSPYFLKLTGQPKSQGEDGAAVLILCAKFTIATSCTCMFDQDVCCIILYLLLSYLIKDRHIVRSQSTTTTVFSHMTVHLSSLFICWSISQ